MQAAPAIVATAALALVPAVAAAEAGPPAAPHRSPRRALALSLGGTLASAAMVGVGSALAISSASPHNLEDLDVVGLGGGIGLATLGVLSSVVTPALGELDAGTTLTVGMGLRVGGLGCGLAALNEGGELTDHRTLLLVGGVAYAAGVVYGLVDAPRAADRFNARHRITMTPTVMVTPSGTMPAMGIGGTF